MVLLLFPGHQFPRHICGFTHPRHRSPREPSCFRVTSRQIKLSNRKARSNNAESESFTDIEKQLTGTDPSRTQLLRVLGQVLGQFQAPGPCSHQWDPQPTRLLPSWRLRGSRNSRPSGLQSSEEAFGGIITSGQQSTSQHDSEKSLPKGISSQE